MTEIRCVKCRRLLFKVLNCAGKIEIKCPKCGMVDIVQLTIKEGDLEVSNFIDGEILRLVNFDIIEAEETQMKAAIRQYRNS